MARTKRTKQHRFAEMFDEERARTLIATASVDAAPLPIAGLEPVKPLPKVRVSTATTAAPSGNGMAVLAVWYGRLSVAKSGLNMGSWSRGQAEMRDAMLTQHANVKLRGTFLDDGISGAAINDLAERERCEQTVRAEGIKILFCEDVDRLGRNAIDVQKFAARLQALGTRIVTVRHGEPERLLFALLTLLAEHEREKTSARVRASRPRHIANGRVLGICPYGYETDENDRLVVYEPEAKIVRFIFEVYATTFVGADQICRMLEELGIPAPNGGERWFSTQLLGFKIHYDDGPERMQGILCRKTYIGERITSIVSTRRDDDGRMVVRYCTKAEHKSNECPRIVDQNIWDRVQKRLRDLQFGHRTARYLLADLLECGVCNGPMILCGANDTVTGPWGVSRRSRCRASLTGACAHTTSYDVASLQVGIIRVLHENLHDPRLVSHYAAGAAAARIEPLGNADALEGQRAEINRILGNLARDKATNMDLDDVYDDQIRIAKERKFRIQASIDRLEKASHEATRFSTDEARAAISRFVEHDIPHDLTLLRDRAQIEAVQTFRDLFVRLAVSPVPGRRSCFGFRCETVFGAHVGVAFVRFQNINEAQAHVIERLRNVKAGLRMRDLTARGDGSRIAKDVVYFLIKYGILERVEGRDGRPRFRLAVKIPKPGPMRHVRFEIKLKGSATQTHHAFVARPSVGDAASPDDSIAA